MRKAFLKTARETLESMKRQLLAEIQQDLKQGRESSKDEGMDTYDLASEEREREINFILTDRERGKLQAIEDALDRIDEGSYGVCESCGGAIERPRLKALPFAKKCMSCQNAAERGRTKYRPFGGTLPLQQLAAEDAAEAAEPND